MRNKLLVILFFIIFSVTAVENKAQVGRGDFGFGIVLGEPTGGTIKYWFSGSTALVASIGGSYFGEPRLGVDYLWHFDAFQSPVITLYAAPGVVLGFGEGGGGYWYKEDRGRFYYRSGNDLGLGIRGIFGLNVVPRRTPLEFFLETGAMVGLAPDFGSAIDLALGLRFYP